MHRYYVWVTLAIGLPACRSQIDNSSCVALSACCDTLGASAESCREQVRAAVASVDGNALCQMALANVQAQGVCQTPISMGDAAVDSARDVRTDAPLIVTPGGYALRAESARWLETRTPRGIEIRLSLAVGNDAAPAPLLDPLFSLRGSDSLLVTPTSFSAPFITRCRSDASVATGGMTSCSLVFELGSLVTPVSLSYLTPTGETIEALISAVTDPADSLAPLCAVAAQTLNNSECSQCLWNQAQSGSNFSLGRIVDICNGDGASLSRYEFWPVIEAGEQAVQACQLACTPPNAAQLETYRQRIRAARCNATVQDRLTTTDSDCRTCATNQLSAINSAGVPGSCVSSLINLCPSGTVADSCLTLSTVLAIESAADSIQSTCDLSCANVCADAGTFDYTPPTVKPCDAQRRLCMQNATSQSQFWSCVTGSDVCLGCVYRAVQACSVNTLTREDSCRDERSCWIACLDGQGCVDQACADQLSGAGGACELNSDRLGSCVVAAASVPTCRIQATSACGEALNGD